MFLDKSYSTFNFFFSSVVCNLLVWGFFSPSWCSHRNNCHRLCSERLMRSLSYSKVSQKALHQWWELLKPSTIYRFMHKCSGESCEKKPNIVQDLYVGVRKAWWKNRQEDKEQAINLSHREMWRLSAGYHRWYMTYDRMIRLLHTNKHNRTNGWNSHSHLTYRESRTSLSELTHVQQRNKCTHKFTWMGTRTYWGTWFNHALLTSPPISNHGLQLARANTSEYILNISWNVENCLALRLG